MSTRPYIEAIGSWATHPRSIRAAWGLALPVLALSYALHGGLLNTYTGVRLMAAPHLMALCGALWVGGIAGLLLGSQALHARPLVMRVTAVAAVGAVAVFSMWAWRHPALPSSREFTAGLGNASALSSPPDPVTAVPAPLGVDETFLVRRQVTLRTYRVGSRELTIDPSPRERDEVRLRLEGELAPAYLQFDDAATFALHRIGPHWILVSGTSRLQRSVIGGPRAGMDLGVADAFPGRVGAGPLAEWCLVLSAPLALTLFALASITRRRLRPYVDAAYGTPVSDRDELVVRTVRCPDGRIVKLTTSVPPETQVVFFEVHEAPNAYREEPRGTAIVLYASRFDRVTTIASARMHIARLDALCVLVVLVLTAPALGAHLRGLTVSLPVVYNAAP